MKNKCGNILWPLLLTSAIVIACAENPRQGSVRQEGDATVFENPEIGGWSQGKIKLVEEAESAIGKNENAKQRIFRIGAIRLTQSGDICILDAGNHRVVVLDKFGDYKFAFGKSSSGPGEVRDPFSMDLDETGNFYVIDSGTGRNDKFSAKGEHLTSSSIEFWVT